jgi:hypothetical protein
MGLGNGLAWQTRKVPKAATFFRFAIDIRAEISQGCKRYATEKSEPREGKMPQSTRLYTAGVAGAAQARRVALNVQGSSQQGVQSLPAKQAITGTAETQMTDPALANANPLVLALPPGGPCEQEAFDITFSGYVTTTQSSTVVFKLYLGASATIGSNTVLASTTSATVATTTVPFRFTVTLNYDSVSGKLTGTYSGIIGGTLTALTALTGAPVSASANNAGTNLGTPVLSFTLTVTFGTGATANTVNLKDFGINH